MSVVRAQTRRRWLIVATCAAVLCALPAAATAIPTGSVRVSLRTLIARIAASADQPYQGYAVATGSSGLPDLPEFGDITSLFNGDTSLRIWYASQQRWRVDTVTTAGERDVYQVGTAQTVWDSAASQLSTVVGAAPARFPRGSDLAPADLGRRLLAEDVPGTTVLTALPTRRIAGISAAGLRLVPSDPQTTVGAVDIWADPRSGLPVEVAVTPVGATKPILVSRMLDISTTAPSVATTTVPRAHPGIGADVTSSSRVVSTLTNLGLGSLPARLAGLPRIDHGLSGVPGIAAYGLGFREVVAVSVYGKTGSDALNAASAVGTVTTTADSRYAIVSTSLLNVLVLTGAQRFRIVTGDGHAVAVVGNPFTVIVVGFVTPDVLTEIATELLADT